MELSNIGGFHRNGFTGARAIDYAACCTAKFSLSILTTKFSGVFVFEFLFFKRGEFGFPTKILIQAQRMMSADGAADLR